MKFIRRYYKNQLVKHSKPSSKRPLDINSSVTVLHSNEMELAAVKKFFNRAQGVRFIGEKRSKEHPPKADGFGGEFVFILRCNFLYSGAIC